MTNLLARLEPQPPNEQSTKRADDDALRPLTWKPVARELEILEVLAQPVPPGEQLAFAFKRKERRLGELFASLNVADSRELHRRCTLGLPGDALAASFRRLVSDRQGRLLAFLADARRREAVRFGRSVR
jgi:hypothetical protein